MTGQKKALSVLRQVCLLGALKQGWEILENRDDEENNTAGCMEFWHINENYFYISAVFLQEGKNNEEITFHREQAQKPFLPLHNSQWSSWVVNSSIGLVPLRHNTTAKTILFLPCSWHKVCVTTFLWFKRGQLILTKTLRIFTNEKQSGFPGQITLMSKTLWYLQCHYKKKDVLWLSEDQKNPKPTPTDLRQTCLQCIFRNKDK